MTVLATNDYSGPYSPDGVVTTFPFTFTALDATDIAVIRVAADGTQAVLTGYTAAINKGAGGSVTFSIAPSAGDPLYVVLSPSFEQQTDFANQGAFSPTSLNAALDRAAMRDIALQAALTRTVVAPPADTLGEMPTAAERAGKYFAFDADGLAIPSSGTGNDSALRTDLAGSTGWNLIGTPFGSLVTTIREKLLADRTYYVRNDGSDSNTGLANTSAAAFLTLQKAVDVVFGTLDLNGRNVAIQAADGTRTAGFSVNSPQVGEGDIFVFGNVATPANCPVNVTGADAFHAENGAVVWLRGFKPTTTTSGACVVAYTGAVINTQAMNFGACAASHIEAGTGGVINLDGLYSISGGAVSHLHCGSFGGIYSAGSFTVTISGTPAFSSYFAGVAQGSIVIPGITWSGSATGPRYLAHHGGLIRAAEIDPALPGDVEGKANAGGIYIASVVNPWVIAPDSTLNNSVELRGHNTGSGAQVPRFVTRADANASASFFANADDCYSSGETQFGSTVRTAVFSGTQDGATFYSQAAIAGGGIPVLEMSNNGFSCARWRRRVSDGHIHEFTRDTTLVGSISVTTTATAYNTSSDYRLKEDARPVANPLDRLALLKPVNFAWRSNGERCDGFLAHELAAVVPQAVTGNKDATDADGNPLYQQVDQSKLVPLLVAAVQQLAAEVQALKA